MNNHNPRSLFTKSLGICATIMFASSVSAEDMSVPSGYSQLESAYFSNTSTMKVNVDSSSHHPIGTVELVPQSMDYLLSAYFTDTVNNNPATRMLQQSHSVDYRILPKSLDHLRSTYFISDAVITSGANDQS